MNAIANPLDPENPFPARTFVIVGMPGAGKSTIARRLASRLHLPFADSDVEVEKAAGMKVERIFAELGEPAFRQGERQVIARMLKGPPHVLATGGGAFMDESSRGVIREHGVSIWLRADIGILLERTSRKDNRPLLKRGNPEDILRELLAVREPVYALADVVVDSDKRPVKDMVDRVIEALDAFARKTAVPAALCHSGSVM
jgi:shikimate kinase